MNDALEPIRDLFMRTLKIKKSRARREERSWVIPNKRRTTTRSTFFIFNPKGNPIKTAFASLQVVYLERPNGSPCALQLSF